MYLPLTPDAWWVCLLAEFPPAGREDGMVKLTCYLICTGEWLRDTQHMMVTAHRLSSDISGSQSKVHTYHVYNSDLEEMLEDLCQAGLLSKSYLENALLTQNTSKYSISENPLWNSPEGGQACSHHGLALPDSADLELLKRELSEMWGEHLQTCVTETEHIYAVIPEWFNTTGRALLMENRLPNFPDAVAHGQCCVNQMLKYVQVLMEKTACSHEGSQ